MRVFNRSQKGISLVEVIIALALVIVIVLSVAGLLPRALEISRKAAMHTTAANLAQAKIEDMISRNYEDIPTGTVEARAPVAPATDPLSIYEREVTSDYVDTDTLAVITTDEGLKQVTVTVFYPSSRGESTVVLNTLISDR